MMPPDNPVVEYSADEYLKTMLQRVSSDFTSAKSFMRGLHDNYVLYHALYHASAPQQYEDLRKKNVFPDSFYQEIIDVATADALDKTFYSGRPCEAIPREETDKQDADAKQALIDHQDREDGTYGKIQRFYKDAFQYGIAVGQPVYTERFKTIMASVQEPLTYLDSETGTTMPQVDPMTGEPQVRTTLRPKEVPVYRGATTQRVDPTNFFPTPEKSRREDEYAMMVRSTVSKDYLKSLPYTFNLDQIKDAQPAAPTDDLTPMKRNIIGLHHDQQATTAPSGQVEYVEWFGMCDKAKLYEYLIAAGRMNPEGAVAEPDEKCWAIIGMANGNTIVRCEESPFPFEGPNIVVGVIEVEEGEIVGLGLSSKIYSIVKALQHLNDTLLENVKQAINSGSIINTSAIKKTNEIKVNRAGWILEVTSKPSDVYARVDVPNVMPDIIACIEMLRQRGQNATGIQDFTSGRGDPSVDTATESSIVSNQAGLRMRNYIKSFEDTFIRPLYEMRDAINMAFLDQPYVIRVIGEQGAEWRTIKVDQIRASVDWVCTGSARETNRAVITQQMLQLADPAALAEKAGFPTRWDKLIRKLVESGFTWTRRESEEYWPTLKADSQGMNGMAIDIDAILIQQFLATKGAILAPPQPPGGGGLGEGGGGDNPEPTSEADALSGAANRNLPDVGGL